MARNCVGSFSGRIFAKVLGALALLSAGAAFAGNFEYDPFANRYPAYYSTYGFSQGCPVCHTSAPALNSTYGADYVSALAARGGRNSSNVVPALVSLEPLDSDGDGYTNIVEINANRKVFDATDHPTTGVSLSAAPESLNGLPSSTVSYTVSVTNNGNIFDDYSLSVFVAGGESGWTPSIVGSANSVGPGFSADITVNVAIPAGALASQYSVARVIASSQAHMGSTGLIDLLTSVAATRTDFNVDGKSDILYRNFTTGQVFLIGKNGLGTTGQGMVYQEPNTAWKIAADADFNADLVADLLWRNSTTGEVYVMPFTSSGLVDGGKGKVIHVEPNPAWKIVQTPDLDGDGRADIVWWNSSTGQVYAMLMNGTTIAAQGAVYTEPDTQWRIVASGDFAYSGKQNQLVWRHGVTGQVYLMTIEVSGSTFTQSGAMIYNEPNPAWKIVAAADFNGDGAADLLWRNDATGQVAMLLMDGGTLISSSIFYAEPDTAWKVVAAGDYNGNGKADILWRNETTGQVYMMLMNGAAIVSQGVVYSEPNTAWKVLGPYEYAR